MANRAKSAVPGWFKLSNYDRAPSLSPLEWAHELQARKLVSDHLTKTTPGITVYAEQIQDRIRHEGLVTAGLVTTGGARDDASVRSLSALEAFSFLHLSLDRNDIDRDLNRVFANYPFFEDKTPSGFSNVGDWNRYQQPYDRWSNIKASRHGPYRHVLVNLAVPDDVLVERFKRWLVLERRQPTLWQTPSAKNFDLSDWAKSRVLPFLDLMRLGLVDPPPTQAAVGAALFPNEIDMNVSEKIRKTVAPKADEIMSDAYIFGLYAIANAEAEEPAAEIIPE